MVKNPPAKDIRDMSSIPGLGRSLGGGMQPTSESHGQRSLVGCNPRVTQSNMTEVTSHACIHIAEFLTICFLCVQGRKFFFFCSTHEKTEVPVILQNASEVTPLVAELRIEPKCI